MLERNTDVRNEVRFFCIEDLVPQDHLPRKIEKAVDFEEIYPLVGPYYCEDNGRPAVDPVVLVKIVDVTPGNARDRFFKRSLAAG